MNILQDRVRIRVFLAGFAIFAIWASTAAASPMGEIERLMPPRTVVCHFEAQDVAGLMVNVRGKLTFLYVDRKLSQALSRQRRAEYDRGEFSRIPAQIFAYATKSKRKHVLFVTRVQALKGWNFDSSMLSIGGFSPAKEDIIIGISDNPAQELRFGERNLAAGYEGFIGFFVPAESVKPGETINLGYATDSVEWIVPE